MLRRGGRWRVIVASLLAFAFALGVLSSIGGFAWLSTHYATPAAAAPVALAWLSAFSLAWFLLTGDRSRALLLACCLVVVVARAVMILVTGGSNMTAADPFYYQQIASNILSGEGIVWNSAWGDLYAVYPPLYAVLLAAAMFLADSSPYAPWMLNTAIDLAAACVIFAIGKEFSCRRAGAAAAYLYLIWPSVLLAAPLPHKEGLVSLLVLTQVYVLARVWRFRRAPFMEAVSLGVATGLLALTQPSLTPLAVLLVVGALCVLSFPELVRLAGYSALAATVVVLPWWIRNWIVLGDFVPLTTSAGLNFYVETMQTWAAPLESFRMREVERMAYLGAIALDWVISHPAEYLQQKVKSAAMALSLDHAMVSNYLRLAQTPRIPAQSFYPVSQLSLIILWIVALGASVASLAGRSRARTFFLVAVAALFMQMLLFNIWFEFAQRHRTFVIPIILLWAALCFQKWRNLPRKCPPTRG